MRVSSLMMTGNYLQQLNKASVRQNQLMEQTDGSSLHRPSDDPINYTKNLLYSTNLTQSQQYSSNVDAAVSWMKSTDTAMVNMSNSLQTIVEKTVATANDTSTTSIQATGKEVLAKVQEIVTQANSQIGGRYLFSGQLDSTQPFSLSDSKVTRGVTKTLDDSQSAFFSDTVDAAGTVTYAGGAAQVGNLKQMLTLNGDDGSTYYLNPQNGNIYTADFVNSGYKNAKNISGHGDKVKAGDECGNISGFDIGTYFNSTGEEKTAGQVLTPSTPANVKMRFATVQQYVVNYNGDDARISMVKKNGNVDPAVDSINVTGQDMFGTKDIFGGSVGTSNLNDVLMAAGQMDAGNSKWLSTDGITLVNNTHSTIVSAETTLAARTSVYNDASATLDNQQTIITEDITNVSGTDVAKLAVQLMTAQTMYNMSLSVGSKILPKSLADYL